MYQKAPDAKTRYGKNHLQFQRNGLDLDHDIIDTVASKLGPLIRAEKSCVRPLLRVANATAAEHFATVSSF